jgi:hypothetical protein
MLYATGTSIEELAKVTGIPKGTITSRSSREKWATDKERVQALAVEAAQQTQSTAESLAVRGKLWPNRVTGITDKAMDVIEKESITDLRSADKVISLTDKVDKVARRSYGLDDENKGNTTVVNLGFLQDVPPKLVSAKVVEADVTEICQ